MADAKIISYSKGIGAGTTVIPDNQVVSLDIESTDGKEFVRVISSDTVERVVLGKGTGVAGEGIPVVIGPVDAGGNEFTVGNGSGQEIEFDIGSTNVIKSQAATNFQIGTHAAHTLELMTANTARLHITAAGLVGINDQTPSAKLTVQASASNEDLAQFNGSEGTVAAQIETFAGKSGALTLYSASGVNQHRISAREGSSGLVKFNETLIDCDFNIGSENLTNAFHVDASADKIGINTAAPAAMLDIKGAVNVALSGTFTATNGDATLSSGSSTSFLTQVEPGSAIEIFEGDGTSRGVYTVSSITSATELELDSTVSGLSSSPLSGMEGKTDGTLFSVQTGDGQTAFKMPKPGRLEVLQASSLKYTNLIIGDSTTGEDITNGFRNLFIGAGAGKEVTNNAGVICIGHSAGSYGTTADGMISIGYQSRGSGGGKTVIIGRDAGSESGGEKSVVIGYRAGRIDAASNSNYFGTNCTMIGAHTKPAADNNSNSIAIGYNAVGHGANTAVIGDANITQIDPHSDRGCNLGQVSYEFDAVHCVSVTEVSDERLKEQIEDTSLGVDFIKRLRPVSYKFKDRAAEYEAGTQTVTNENGEEVEEPVQILRQPALTHTRKHQGLIAQEVKQVLDDIGMDAADFGGYVDGNISGDGDKYALRYGQFIGPLIKAVQELTARIEELENGE
tara:strand:- start:116 stop:2149 length:2034 start_codon:yes stop_codon:yes gene_type:complete